MSAVTPRGITQCNPFDIEYSPRIYWVGQQPGKDLFVTFDTPVHGIRAGMKDAHNKVYVDGLNTITKLISKFAPPSENDTVAYISHMSKVMGIKADDPLDLSTVEHLILWAKGIITQEVGHSPTGGDWYSDQTYLQAAQMVLGISTQGNV
jgi:hypothetical protein